MTDSQEQLEKEFMKVYLSGLRVESTYMALEDYVYFFTDTCYMSLKTLSEYMRWKDKLEKECPLLKELR